MNSFENDSEYILLAESPNNFSDSDDEDIQRCKSHKIFECNKRFGELRK